MVSIKCTSMDLVFVMLCPFAFRAETGTTKAIDCLSLLGVQ